MWTPVFHLEGNVRIVTALASLGTALDLPSLVPKALALVTSAQLSEERRVHLDAAQREPAASRRCGAAKRSATGCSSGNRRSGRTRNRQPDERRVPGDGVARAAHPAERHARVSDIGMPEQDGHALIQAIRAAEGGGRRLPAVALTSGAGSAVEGGAALTAMLPTR